MSKSVEKLKARLLRQEGQSIRTIAKGLSVSKGTVSIWCRDIQLSPVQIAQLEQDKIAGGWKGRLKGAETQKRRRILEIKDKEEEGIREVSSLADKELFTAGLGVYLGEGVKNPDAAITLSNSNPKIIVFMLNWFRKFCLVSNDKFICHISINSIHRDRLHEVEEYWSKVTQLPLAQFTKTTLLKVDNKKVYDSLHTHYGTLRLKVRKSRIIQRKMLGWIKGLLDANVAQW